MHSLGCGATQFLDSTRPMERALGSKQVCILTAILLAVRFAFPQQAPQTPSPMTENTRPHPRITQTDVPGRRIELKSLKGARAFVGPKVDLDRPVPLIVHFHGTTWLIERHVFETVPKAVLITVNLGSGSSVYGRPFAEDGKFQELIDEAAKELGVKRGWSSITLSGFSAGYGAVRAILRHEKYFGIVNNVLLMDGMHASYSPEGKVLAEGGAVNAADLDSFVRFAREAAAGRKTFVFTHSEIFPGTYASTTECAAFVLGMIGSKERATLKKGPIGMQQLSSTRVGHLTFLGFAGNTAPDHVDHLQAMPFWLRRLKF